MIKIFSLFLIFQNLINSKPSKLGNDERFDTENDVDVIYIEKISLEKIKNNMIKKQLLEDLMNEKIQNVTKIKLIEMHIEQVINYGHDLSSGGLENDFDKF